MPATGVNAIFAAAAVNKCSTPATSSAKDPATGKAQTGLAPTDLRPSPATGRQVGGPMSASAIGRARVQGHRTAAVKQVRGRGPRIGRPVRDRAAAGMQRSAAGIVAAVCARIAVAVVAFVAAVAAFVAAALAGIAVAAADGAPTSGSSTMSFFSGI
jgi:hypothetical protein